MEIWTTIAYSNIKSLYEFFIPKTMENMIVYQSHSLHHRITNGGPYEYKASFLEIVA
jgi:hypothetical protein